MFWGLGSSSVEGPDRIHAVQDENEPVCAAAKTLGSEEEGMDSSNEPSSSSLLFIPVELGRGRSEPTLPILHQ